MHEKVCPEVFHLLKKDTLFVRKVHILTRTGKEGFDGLMIKWMRPQLVVLSTSNEARGACITGTGDSGSCAKGVGAGGSGGGCRSGNIDAVYCSVGTGQNPACTSGSSA